MQSFKLYSFLFRSKKPFLQRLGLDLSDRCGHDWWPEAVWRVTASRGQQGGRWVSEVWGAWLEVPTFWVSKVIVCVCVCALDLPFSLYHTQCASQDLSWLVSSWSSYNVESGQHDFWSLQHFVAELFHLS